MGRYRVKEIFGPTIQGEGAHAGMACVFLRFAACNLACSWCDTDFAPAGAAFLDAAQIVARLVETDIHASRNVIVTGGEPALQWSAELATAIASAGFRVHMETNGTTPLAAPVDWLTISPKPQFHPSGISLTQELVPNEVKVVVDETVDQACLEQFEKRYECEHWFVQPCDGEHYERQLATTLELVAKRTRWRLSLQLHKIIGVP